MVYTPRLVISCSHLLSTEQAEDSSAASGLGLGVAAFIRELPLLRRGHSTVVCWRDNLLADY